MVTTNPSTLSPHYYRDNFLRLCDTVEAQYADMLTAAEQHVLQLFRGMEFKAQCLYVRMISRAGPWFRESKLAYTELGAVPPLVDHLLAHGMACQAEALSVEELGQLFTLGELQQIFPALAKPRTVGKAALLSALEQQPLSDVQARQAITCVDPGRIIAPGSTELTALLQLLFFGNRYQGLTDFVLQDLGVTRYYPYTLNREHRLFSCRDAVTEYAACAQAGDERYLLIESGELQALGALATDVASMDIRFESSHKSWYRLCNNLARDMERLGEHELALALYSRSQRHPARERRCRILEREGDWAGAIALCNEIRADAWCEAEHEAAQRILPRVQRKLDGTRIPRQRDTFAQTTLELQPEAAPVEQLVARSLEAQWQSVHYVENKLLTALFGLAFWEQIFAPVPGVFHNPYQSAPGDMYDATFRSTRSDAITARMAQLRATDLTAELVDAYHQYCDYQCRWVDWRRIDASLVERSTRIIPATHLLAIWERILFDPRENRRGFPDLIALGTKEGDYQLIEVKGPGDTLQDNQKRWLRFFQAHDIPAQVAWVNWRDD